MLSMPPRAQSKSAPRGQITWSLRAQSRGVSVKAKAKPKCGTKSLNTPRGRSDERATTPSSSIASAVGCDNSREARNPQDGMVPHQQGSIERAVSDEVTCCPMCLDDLHGQQLGVCLDDTGRRSCPHYFHLACLRQVEGKQCPMCRVRFYKRAPLPNIKDEPASWVKLVSLSGKDSLTKLEVCASLNALLPLSSHKVSTLVESSWDEWTQGEELLGSGSLHKLVATIEAHLHDGNNSSEPICIEVADNNSSGTDVLEDGHRSSGVVCKCGQIHVRRGDRIRRGPAWSEVDGAEVVAGQFGTIVRVGPDQESVFVHWDRCPGKMYCYTWPDPCAEILAPSSFQEIPPDVLELQGKTNLSSVAVDRLLQRSPTHAAQLLAEGSKKMTEEMLREDLQPFHRVRILPDSVLVQEWFDRCPPCQCSNPNCRGGQGVRWTHQAERHLGREGYLLKIDESDDSVLVRTSGPCTCKIWYPRLAVEPAFDPDLEDEPSFEVQARVECKMQEGWKRGTVTEVCWRGRTRTGPEPYEVLLDDGNSILVPNEHLIRPIS